MPARSRSLEEAFWAKADRRGPEECWPWTGKINWKGYGRLSRIINGRLREIPAARAAYIVRHGSFPEGMFACHTCDNRSCVNPAHIWPGTHLENMADMRAKKQSREQCRQNRKAA